MLPAIIAVDNGAYNTGSGNYANEAKWSTAWASARAVEKSGKTRNGISLGWRKSNKKVNYIK